MAIGPANHYERRRAADDLAVAVEASQRQPPRGAWSSADAHVPHAPGDSRQRVVTQVASGAGASRTTTISAWLPPATHSAERSSEGERDSQTSQCPDSLMCDWTIDV